MTKDEIEECRKQFVQYVRGYTPTEHLPVGSIHYLCDKAALANDLAGALRAARELVAFMANEYEIGDEAGELQHWHREEAIRCRKAVELRNSIDALLARLL